MGWHRKKFHHNLMVHREQSGDVEALQHFFFGKTGDKILTAPSNNEKKNKQKNNFPQLENGWWQYTL